MLIQTEIPSRSFRFSIHVDGKEIGRASIVLIKNDLHEQPYGLLEDVWVDHTHRNQGHATTLVQVVVERAKIERCYKLVATSRLERKRVHDLYKQLGFRLHGLEFRMDF